MTRERNETKIPPIVGAALCMAFRGTLSRRQQDTLGRFKAASPQFAAMWKLAMNFERFCSALIRLARITSSGGSM
jgi:hypothetical protein